MQRNSWLGESRNRRHNRSVRLARRLKQARRLRRAAFEPLESRLLLAHVPVLLDMAGTRTPLANEGLLAHRSAAIGAIGGQGEERTGWTDVRHPAHFASADPALNITTTDNDFGYDRSDKFVEVNNVIVTDSAGTAAGPSIERDFDFANQIYAQIGLSVLNEANVAANYPAVTFPLSNAEVATLRAANRAAAPVVNNYYATSFDNGRFGTTASLEDSPDHGTVLADTARNDSFTHELGHFLVDEHRFDNGGASVHSPNATDLMASGGTRTIPGATTKSAANSAPANPGVPNGNLGGTSRFDALMNDGAGGPFNISQTDAIFTVPTGVPANPTAPNPFVTHRDDSVHSHPDNGRTHGDAIDFKWVEDNLRIDETSADNHATGAADPLLFHISPLDQPNAILDHNHGTWIAGTVADPANEPELSLTSLASLGVGAFTVIDVVSQIARYADNDVNAAGDWSARESALDYDVEFSTDGAAWVAGTPLAVFIDGWTTRSRAEDFIARWAAPFEAAFVRIFASTAAGHDQNTQIDAVVAANARGAIHGQVFEDLDGDGMHHIGEFGLAGRSVFLDLNSNSVLDAGEPSTTTDAAGLYEFNNLLPGRYTVVEQSPPGWHQTTAANQILVLDATVNDVDLGSWPLFTGSLDLGGAGVQLALIEGLQAVEHVLDDLGEHQAFAAPMQLVGESFGQLLDMGDAFQAGLVATVEDYLANDGTPTAEEFVTTLVGLTVVDPVFVASVAPAGLQSVVSDVAGGQEWQVDLTFQGRSVQAGRELGIGFTGLASAGLAADLTNEFTLDFSFGLTPDGSGGYEFFAAIDDLTAETSTANASANEHGLRGFAAVEIQPLASFAYGGQLGVAFANPDGDSQGRLSRLELLGNSISALTTVTPAATDVNIALEVQTELGSFSTAGTSPLLSIASANPFDGAPPIHAWNADAAVLSNFEAIQPEQVVELFDQAGDWLQSIVQADFFEAPIPFTENVSIDDLIDLGQLYDTSIGNWLTIDPETPGFTSAQSLALLLSNAGGGSLDGILDYDPATNRLTFDLNLHHVFDTLDVPLAFDFDLAPIGEFQTSAQVTLSAAAGLQATFGIDLTPLGANFQLTPATNLAGLHGGLGVPLASGAGQFDLHIALRDGSTHDVPLTGATNIGHVLAALNAVPGLEAEIEEANDSLKLTDKTAGTSLFEVTLADSLAAAMLGVLVADEDGDGILLGKPLHGEGLGDRFYIENAAVEGTVLLEATDIDAHLTALFLGFDVADGSASASGAFQVPLVDPGLIAADGRIAIGELSNAILSDPGSLIGAATFSGTAALAFDDITVTGDVLDVLPESPSLVINVPDIGNLGSTTLTHNLQLGDFNDFDLGAIIDLLRGTKDFLASLESFSLLDDDLPLINQSFGDLVDYADQLADQLDQLAQNPSATLVEFEQELESLLGINDEDFALSYNAATHVLDASLAFSAAYADNLSLNLDLLELIAGAGGTVPGLDGLSDLVDAAGSGSLAIDVGALLTLDMGVDLTNPASPAPFVYDTTGVALTAELLGTKLNFTAAAGPLGLFIKDGSATIDADGDPLTSGPATLSVGLANDPTDGRYLFNELGFHLVDMDLTAGASVDLPLFFPTENNALTGGRDPDGDGVDNSLTVEIPDLAALFGGANNVSIVTPNLSFELTTLDLLNHLYLVVDGVDWLLGAVQDGLDGEVFGVRLPLIGDRLTDAAQFIGDFRSGLMADVRSFLAMNPPTPANIEAALVQFLGDGPQGLDILGDLDGNGIIDAADVNVDVDPSGDDLRFELVLSQAMTLASAGIDFDIGIDALGLEVDAQVELMLGYAWTVAFGVNRSEGFYIDATNTDELQVTLEATIPGSTVTGKLLFLQLDVTDNALDPSHLTGAFTVDIVDPGGADADGVHRLAMSDILSGTYGFDEIIQPAFVATADLNLDLVVSFGGNAVFPSLVADFHLDWQFDTSLPGEDVSLVPQIAFNNVGLDLGSFISDFARPIVEKVVDVLNPIKPAIDVLMTRLPVLSDIDAAVSYLDRDGNGDVSILDMALNQGVGGEQLQYINDFLKVYRLLEKINAIPAGGGLIIPIGSFDLGALDVRNLEDLQDVGLGDLNIQAGDVLSVIAEEADALINDFLNDALQTENADSPLGGVSSAESQFAFPILDDPTRAFRLLLGQDVELVTYDLAPLQASFEFHEFFPIFWFLGVQIDGGISATADFAFGYDTRGFRDFVEGGLDNPLDIFNGFYVNDRENADGSGADVPEIVLHGFLDVAAALDAIVASASVGGGIEATIEGDLNDLDNDGKFRLDELIETFPLCMFDIDGQVTAGAFAKVKVGFGPFSYTKRWNIAETTLADFSYSCNLDPDPVLATNLGGGVLRLNVGPHAAERQHGDLDGTAGETIRVFPSEDDPTAVIVSAFGYTQEYAGVSRIVADGGGGDDVIQLDPALNVSADLTGGPGNDRLTAGLGLAVLRGGDGDDELTGGPLDDELYGQAGNDTLNGLAGDDHLDGGDDQDVVYGDEGHDVLLGGAGPDFLYGGAGVDEIRGGAGVDLMEGDNGDDLLFGDGGADVINGGFGNDYIEGGSGDDEILAGLGDDRVRADAGDDVVYGGDGDDELDGGAGDDELFGQAGNDTLIGNAGNDLLHGEAGDDDLSGGSGRDILDGNEGHDTLRGDGGNDDLFGHAGNDVMYGGAGDDLLEGDIGDDELHGDGGHDRLFGQVGNDILFGGSGQDRLEGDVGDDELHGGSGIDELLGNEGRDTIRGDAGDDRIFGHDGDDLLFGGDGRDRIEGAAGDDTAYGGDDSDLLIGDVGRDTLYGGFGDDVILAHLIGDNSTTTNGEYIEGGPDNDFLCGTDGRDEIYGGTADAGYAILVDEGDLAAPQAPLPGGYGPFQCHIDASIDPQFPYDPEIDEDPTDISAAVTGRVFSDANGNAIDDAGEVGLAGLVVFADLNNNGVRDGNEPSATTRNDDLATPMDETGLYRIAGLAPGEYTLRQELPPGYEMTRPVEGFYTIELEESDVLENVLFGNHSQHGSIAGVKWHDLDGDGVRKETEPGLGGVTIYLDLNKNGQFDGDEPRAVSLYDDPSTSADEAGRYEITDVVPGEYVVHEVVPSGYVQTYPANTGGAHEVTVDSQAAVTRIDFGNRQNVNDPDGNNGASGGSGTGGGLETGDGPGTGSLSGAETRDQPHSATAEKCACPLSDTLSGTWPEAESSAKDGSPNDALVYVSDAAQNEGHAGTSVMTFDVVLSMPVNYDVLIDYTTSDDSAQAGSDYVATSGSIVIPAGATLVQIDVPINGDTAGEPDETFVLRLVNVVGAAIGNDKGVGTILNDDPIGTAEIHGVKFIDQSDNGVWDAGEPREPGITIYIDVNANRLRDPGEPSTVTQHDDPATPADETGSYSFSGLLPGSFEVREVLPNGWSQTFPSTGFHVVTLGVGQVVTDIHFGNVIRLPDGDDLIFAAGQNDVVYGDNLVSDPRVRSVGTRMDTIDGGSGDDELFGQERDDQLLGGPGADAIDGGSGVDRVLQTVDNDQTLTNGLLTGQGPDTLSGIERATLTGGASANVIDASGFTAGPVMLIGLDGDDSLLGGAGDDELLGGDGSDQLAGGAGDDRYVFENDWGIDTLVDDGGSNDIVDFTGAAVDLLVTIGSPLTVGDGINLLTHAGDAVEQVLSGAGNDTFRFHDDNAALAGGLGIVDAGSGRDTLDYAAFTAAQPVTVDLSQSEAHGVASAAGFENVTGGAGDDHLTGDAQDNTLYGNAGDDVIFGGAGDDVLFGGADGDILVAGSGNDVLEGGGGDDQLSDGLGNDTLLGGNGDDLYRFETAALGEHDIVGEDVGDGADTLDFSTFGDAVTIDLDAVGLQVVTAAGHAIELTAPIENVIGTPLDDFIKLAAGTQPRSVDGGDPAAPALPGDTLVLDAQGGSVLLSGDIIRTDGPTPVTAAGIESLQLVNAAKIVVDAGAAANDGSLDDFLVDYDSGDKVVTINGQPVFRTPAPAAPHIIIQGSDDDDVLTVAFDNGNPIPAGLTYHGGDQQSGDTLILTGAGALSGVYTPDPKTFGNGHIDVGGTTIDFTGLEPVLVQGFQAFTFVSPNSQDELTIDSPAAGRNRISGTSGGVAFETLEFQNVAEIVIDAGQNDLPGRDDDRIVFASDLTATNLQQLTLLTGTGADQVDASAVKGFKPLFQEGVVVFTPVANAVPVPLTPTGSTSNTRPAFSWRPVAGAAYYDLWVNNISTGKSQVIRETKLTSTKHTPAKSLPVSDYRYWVRAFDSKGRPTAWSAPQDFSISTFESQSWSSAVDSLMADWA